MPLDQLLALISLAVAGSFTPGPNNTIATVTAANHGFRATVPHMLGVPVGFSTMLLAGSLGVAALLIAHPLLAQLIKWLGIAYLLYIAWLIAGSASLGERSIARPLTFWQSAAFQYANPKAWMLAAATAATFMAQGANLSRTSIVVAVYAVAAVLSLVLWAGLGAALCAWLTHGQRLRLFNLAMGVLLAATAVWMALF
ncbi:MAG: LysE family translocator [Betaproteobacteria bacterium]|jgi:threonine/homoserine/homoserine lactone efflux protein